MAGIIQYLKDFGKTISLIWEWSLFSNSIIPPILSLLYTLNLSDNWAEFPDYDVLYSKNWFSEHSLIAGLEYSLTDNLTAGLEGGIKYTLNNFNDYYSNVFAKQ